MSFGVSTLILESSQIFLALGVMCRVIITQDNVIFGLTERYNLPMRISNTTSAMSIVCYVDHNKREKKMSSHFTM
jgi:hypothetical protein